MVPIPRVPAALMLALLAGAFAGCTGGAPEPGTTRAPAGSGDGALNGVEFPWGLESCRASYWLAPASSEALREYLPEGFEPAETPQLPGIDVVAGLDTYVGFDAFECRSGTTLNGAVGPLVFGSLFARVTPPDEYAIEGLDGGYFFRWEVLVPDQPRFDRFAGLGLAVRAGRVNVEALTPAGSPGPWQTTLTLDGLGSFSFNGMTTEPEAPGDDVPYAAYTPAAAGVATWRAIATDLTAAGGWGEWSVEPGSWVADVLGADHGVGPFSVGTWSIINASLFVPAAHETGNP